MERENSEIVVALYEAFGRKDVLLILQLLDPQFEIVQTELLPWGGHYRGHQEAMIFFGRLTEYLDSQPQPEEYISAGDQIVAIGRVRGHVKANGQPFDVRLVHIWTVRQGKALRFEAYIDTTKMLEVLAL